MGPRPVFRGAKHSEPSLVGNNEAQDARNRALGRRWWQRRWLQVVAVVVFLVSAALVIAGEYVLHQAEPILRRRVIETLSARFDAPVTLDHLDLSLFKGIEVSGWGLRIPLAGGLAQPSGTSPLVKVRHFAFHTTFRGLLHQPTQVAVVRVEGMELHIPPSSERGRWLGVGRGHEAADPGDPKLKPKVAIVVGELICREVKLYVEPGKPGKDPLMFDIAAVDLHDPGRDQAMRYDAQLTNPRPAGNIHATGHFGPWAGATSPARASDRVPDPGQTPLDGDYTFEHADLNTIKGVGGILSSKGHFSGVLDRITVDGVTDTPDFSLDISARPVPLQTAFHAIVDGTSGDTYLEQVRARLESSEFTTRGKIVKVQGEGHDIQLDVDIPHGRMQDFLRLAVKTKPPLMNGVLSMRAKLHIPPGKQRVTEKMEMAGAFHLLEVRFNNAKMQDQVDGLSARAQGRPKAAAEVSHDADADVRSQLEARFDLRHGVMSVTEVRYGIPGALVLLNGVYSMDGRLFEFKGHVRTEATASQMVSGWKSWLLKPMDSLLKRDGAGLVLPIEITGTEGDMHFGLAMHGTDQTPKQMLAEMKGRQRQEQEERKVQREVEQADALDAEAARAPTLEAAERAHNAAVKRRAEALSRMGSADKGGALPHR